MVRRWKLYAVSAILGFIVFLNRIIYELPNPDAIWNGMVWKDLSGWETSLGRYMIGVWQTLKCNTINPTITAVVCIVILAGICVIVVDIMDIRGIGWQIVVAVLISLSPSVGGTLTYYYCSDMYMFAYLLSVLAVWIVVKKREIWWYVLASVCLMLSLATYQAYLPIAIVISVIYIVKNVLDSEVEFRQLICKAGILIIVGISGIILYLVGFKLVQIFAGVTPEAGRGFSQMGVISIANMPKIIIGCYRKFAEYYLSTMMINNKYGFRRLINIIFFVLCILIGICFLKKELDFTRKIVFVIMCVTFPLAAMSICIMAPEVSIYDTTGSIMLPTMNYVYVFVVAIINLLDIKSKLKKLIGTITIASIVMVVYMLLVMELQGQIYQKKYMDKTYAVAQNIIFEINKFDCNKLCIIGTMENGNYPEQYPELKESLHWLTASYGTIWTDYNGTQGCWQHFISNYGGADYCVCSIDEYKNIVETQEYKDMTTFPKEGSVGIINDVIVVKLSEGTW
jgi:hypothetical protein